MPDFTTAMVAMIGIGVGIDYALFIVTRYREALHAGFSVEDSVEEAIDTSGRAVIFAGTTVVISLMGLTLIGLEFVTAVAIAAAIGVVLMVFVSLTLLPALLGWVGDRIDVTTRAALIAVGLVVVGLFVGVAFGAAAVSFIAILLAVGVIVGSFFFKARFASTSPTAGAAEGADASGTAGAASSSTIRGAARSAPSPSS